MSGIGKALPFLFCLFGSLTFADTREITMEECVNLALHNGLHIREAEETVRIQTLIEKDALAFRSANVSLSALFSNPWDEEEDSTRIVGETLNLTLPLIPQLSLSSKVQHRRESDETKIHISFSVFINPLS